MKLKVSISILLCLFIQTTYAAETPVSTVGEGAQQYDWQTCVHDKAADCLNGCQISENKDCGDNCKELARDKCVGEGLSPAE